MFNANFLSLWLKKHGSSSLRDRKYRNSIQKAKASQFNNKVFITLFFLVFLLRMFSCYPKGGII